MLDRRQILSALATTALAAAMPRLALAAVIKPDEGSALLVIDVQNEYFTGALPITHPAGHLDQILKVMDAAAFSLCMDNQIPILVFDFFKRGELLRVVRGEKAGTWVTA